MEEEKKKCKGLSIASLVLGIIAIVLSIVLIGGVIGVLGVILGLIGIIKSKPKSRMAIVGFILSLIAIAITSFTVYVATRDTYLPTIEQIGTEVYVGEEIDIASFVKVTDLNWLGEDNNDNVEVTYEPIDTTKEGQQTLKVVAKDDSNNKTEKEIKINVKNPKISLYDYIEQKLKTSQRYSNGSYDDKFVIKYDYNFGNGITSKGWVNFTDEVHYSYSKINTGFSIVSTGDLTYFNNEYKVSKVYTSAGLTTGTLAIDKYLKDGNQGFTQEKGDLSSYQSSLDSEISSINDLLNNKNGKISLAGKTIEQLKSETIDIREMQ